MFLRNIYCISNSIRFQPVVISIRNLCDKKPKKEPDLGLIGSKYKIFKEEESEIIFDINEEKLKYPDLIFHHTVKTEQVYEGINLKRGIQGVFDIEDLVNVLNRENAQDIFVSKVPLKLSYVDYIVAVNGKSKRHMQAIAEFVRKVYKHKRNPTEIIPKIEGKDSDQWLALDLGNIALHIFSAKARKTYDIDSLWAVGYEFDPESNKLLDPITEMLESNISILQQLKPK